MNRPEPQPDISRVRRLSGYLPDGVLAGGATPRRQKLRETLYRKRWFLGIVVAPTLLAGLYFGLIASDLYVSEARFIVRKGSGEATSPFGGFLQGTGLMPAQDNSLAIQTFIMSRDAVRSLEKRVGLREVLNRPEGDFLMRFPRPFSGSHFEQLHDQFGKYVTVVVDPASGITTLKVKTFRPEDSRKVAMALLADSEALVNRLNRRAQRDQMQLARNEVDLAEKKVLGIQSAITAYRLRNNMLDPATGSTPVLEVVGALSGQLAASQAQLQQTLAEAPGSPQLGSMREEVRALEKQIAQERGKLAGGDKSMAMRISEYERLFMQRTFAEKQMASALSFLEASRLRAAREYLYLERIAEPNLADYPLFPRRFYSFLMVVVSVLLIFGIGKLVSASVKEHVGR